MKNIKIGNVEYKETPYITEPGKTYEEIVLWEKNPRYQKEEEYKKDGWEFDEEGNAHKDICHIDGKLFKMEYTCYQVAQIVWNNAHDEFDVKSCGLRAFELNDEDYRDFKAVLKLIENYID